MNSIGKKPISGLKKINTRKHEILFMLVGGDTRAAMLDIAPINQVHFT
ncbi:hypothetical protein C4J84_1809 [Pseudomonas sp. R11-23-07]|nr:hypothetical protein C4J86_1902 [Pseudomonas sp. R2-7-07]AZF57696.1 hypothetical protein C4J84_1809 [Pseudomonas sp. R11-23-07]